MGQRTSVYLDDDLHAAVKASGVPRRAHPPRPGRRNRRGAAAISASPGGISPRRNP
jgi:hypothetical protein